MPGDLLQNAPLLWINGSCTNCFSKGGTMAWGGCANILEDGGNTLMENIHVENCTADMGGAFFIQVRYHVIMK